MFGFLNVAAITMICYLVGMGVKVSKLDDKFIPVIVGAVGGLIGALAFCTGMPDFPASDIITAIAVGISSGLAATGANQAVKQLKQNDDDLFE